MRFAPLELTGLTKVFQTSSGPFTAVKDVNARIQNGEFICILGHSGCGKSTVLSMIAGLEQATSGGVVIDGKKVDGPGSDRAVVFQTPCLFPWLTARQNVGLAVDRALKEKTRRERAGHVEQYLGLLGIASEADQLPAELSLGTQQCVALARALSTQPRFLLLDEPFSMLDSLTRLDLQDTLLEVWEKLQTTVVMVTHDIDEALYLSDRLFLMTDGPAASIAEVLDVPFARPRRRVDVLEHPDYYSCRSRIMDSLERSSAPPIPAHP